MESETLPEIALALLKARRDRVDWLVKAKAAHRENNPDADWFDDQAFDAAEDEATAERELAEAIIRASPDLEEHVRCMFPKDTPSMGAIGSAQ